MIYVRGAHAPSPLSDSAIAHASRVAAELGADIIKIPAPKDDEVLAGITAGLPVPIVVAGGCKIPETRMFLERIERSLVIGARGVAVGRNVFQHSRPEPLLRAVGDIVHHGLSAAEAYEGLSAS
jgi:class I fructose-bisphosphate aldolase